MWRSRLRPLRALGQLEPSDRGYAPDRDGVDGCSLPRKRFRRQSTGRRQRRAALTPLEKADTVMLGAATWIVTRFALDLCGTGDEWPRGIDRHVLGDSCEAQALR